MQKTVAFVLALLAGSAIAADPSAPRKPRAAVRAPAKASAPVRAPSAAAKAGSSQAICTEDCGRPALGPARKLENPAASAAR